MRIEQSYFILSAFLRLNLFDQIGIRNLLSVTNYIHAFGIPGVLNVAAENDGGDMLQ